MDTSINNLLVGFLNGLVRYYSVSNRYSCMRVNNVLFLPNVLPSKLDLFILTYYICYILHAYVRRRLLSSLPVVIVGSTRTSQLSAYIFSFTSSTLMSYFDHPPRFDSTSLMPTPTPYLLHFFNGEAIIRLPINRLPIKLPINLTNERPEGRPPGRSDMMISRIWGPYIPI